jgi:hypothetical protein
MENVVVEAEENAQAMLLAICCIGHFPCLHLGLVPIVVFDRSDLLVVRDVKVVIEVAAK